MNRFVIIFLLNNQKINYLHYTYTKTHTVIYLPSLFFFKGEGGGEEREQRQYSMEEELTQETGGKINALCVCFNVVFDYMCCCVHLYMYLPIMLFLPLPALICVHIYCVLVCWQMYRHVCVCGQCVCVCAIFIACA